MPSLLKCKMCGGDLRIISGLNIAECEYCGTRQSVPRTPDERKTSYFNRANETRRANEFDKAIGIYESIVAEYPDEAEAYWGLCLCKLGIEYVDDPKTGKKIPTCHRTVFESIFEDKDYLSAISNGDTDQIRVYKQEAAIIDKLQKSILKSVSIEKPYDVFICYKETDERTGQRTQESVIGQEIFENLCSRGIRTFFARVSLEDVLGEEYEPHIFAALNSARIMLVLGSSKSNYNAPWVRNEWSRYLELVRKDKAHSMIPCFISMDPYDLPTEFSSLQAQDLGKVGALQDIIRGIEKVLGKTSAKITQNEKDIHSVSKSDALLERGRIALSNKDWNKAQSFFDECLNSDPRNAEIYSYLLMTEYKCRSIEELSLIDTPIKNSLNYINTMEFANEDLARKMSKISDVIDIRNDSIKRKRKKRIIILIGSIVSLILVGVIILSWNIFYPRILLNKANKMLRAGEYKSAYDIAMQNKNDAYNALYEELLLDDAKISIEKGDYEFALNILEDCQESEKKSELKEEVIYQISLQNIGSAKKGDTVFFGNYEQDNCIENGKEPIEWTVGIVEDNRKLLVSCKVLEYMEISANTASMHGIKNFLNTDFLQTAFGNDEQSIICEIERNESSDFDGNNMVFILNKKDLDSVYPNPEDRKCQASDYAIDKGVIRANNNGNSPWLIDKQGWGVRRFDKHKIMYISTQGYHMLAESSSTIGIRPAIWVYVK